MTPDQFNLFLTVGIGLCVLMAFVNFLRIRSKGVRMAVLGGAFLFFGLMLLSLKLAFHDLVTAAMGAITLFLLVIDFALRSAQRQGLETDKEIK